MLSHSHFCTFLLYRNVFQASRNVPRILNVAKCRSGCVVTALQAVTYSSEIFKEDTKLLTKSKKKMSKAMKAYIERAHEYDKFMKSEKMQYELGKRHLANMMGEDPEMFTQEDIDKAIEYLFPSGLYERKARPVMKPPEEIFPPKKAAEFDESGRPFHFLFYTGKQNFYQIMFDAVTELNKLKEYEDRMIQNHIHPEPGHALNMSGSEWLPKESLEVKVVEKLHDREYREFVTVMERIMQHPYGTLAQEFVSRYRKPLMVQSLQEEVPKPSYDGSGRAFVTVERCHRKSACSTVTAHNPGTGKVTINGQGIDYFDDIQSREQVLFPLVFTGLLNKVDIEAVVEGGGSSGQAGAVRYGVAMALRSFVDDTTVERMRLAGLLTQDIRRRERKKPGQPKARKKATWKKR